MLRFVVVGCCECVALFIYVLVNFGVCLYFIIVSCVSLLGVLVGVFMLFDCCVVSNSVAFIRFVVWFLFVFYDL